MVKQKFDEKLEKDFLIYTNFLNMITISYYYEKVFILTNI